MKQIAALLLLLVAGAGIAVAGAVVPGLKRLLRGVVLALSASLLVIGLAIGLGGWIYEAWEAIAVGAVLGLVALGLGASVRRPRRPPPPHGPEWAHVPRTAAAADTRWSDFERQLDWVGRRQARAARTAMGAFLVERESPALTIAHRDLILRVEKRVPELLDICLDRCRNARTDERDRYLDETLARLRQIGSEAEQARREVRSADDRRLETLHRYFDGTMGER